MKARKRPMMRSVVAAPQSNTKSCTKQLALLLTTSVQVLRVISLHGIQSVSRMPEVWNRMFRIGMMVMNEKMFSSADRMLNTTVSTRYFLYGGTNRRSTFRNSFIS